MAYLKGYKLKDLRKRILEVGASYVGQVTENKKFVNSSGDKEWTKAYFEDPDFEKKMRGIGWYKGAHYCNFTVRLIYKEALTEGNSYVSSTTSYPDTWDNSTSKGSYLFPPVDISGRTNITKWEGNNKYGAQYTNVEYTRKNYQKPNRYISITNNPNFDKGISGEKNLGQASKAKKYIEGGYIAPGDFITFDWYASTDNKKSSKSQGRFNQHIGIYIAPATSDYSKILCLEGNTTKHGRNGVWIVERNISLVNGFGQLITRKNL